MKTILPEALAARVRAVEALPREERWLMPREERVALISDLASAGYSAGNIAAVYCASRNSIIGIAHRSKVALGATPRSSSIQKHNSRKAKRERAALERKPKPAAEARVLQFAPKPEPLPPETIDRGVVEMIGNLTVLRRPTEIHITKAETEHCKFPLWGNERKPHVDEMFFCGEIKADPKLPYCDKCAASGLTYIPEVRRRRAA